MNRLMNALILLTLLAVPVFAQQVSGPPPIDRVNTDRIRQQEMSSREYQLRNFGKESNAPKDQRQLKALMAQTEEDFTRILTLHNEIARAITTNDTLNYQFVSEATGEIKKRASRVQSSLALRLSAEEAAKFEKLDPKKDLPIKDELIRLCNQIRSFVTNPSIENPNTINAEQMTKARRDLEDLIQLSGKIKKDAEKLSKNP
jgi:hypothetical protein